MAEERIVQAEQSIDFEGVFSLRDINKTVFDFFTQQGYLFFEKLQEEQVQEKKKTLYFYGDFKKKLNYYAESVISFKLRAKDFRDVTVERDRHKEMMQKGTIKIKLEAVLSTDLEGRFEVNLFAYLARAFSERFFFRREIDHLMETVDKDFKKALSIIRGMLNLQKYA